MKFFSIAKKDLKELLRDRRGLFFILLFPMFFMLIFGFAFGGMGQDNQPHNIAIINYDNGAILPGTGEHVNFGNNLTNQLKDAKYEESNVHIFNITKTTESKASSLMYHRDIDLELIIPSGFSQSIIDLKSMSQSGSITSLTTVNSSNKNTKSTLIIRGDTSYINFGTSQSILTSILAKMGNNIQGTTGAQVQDFIKTKIEGIGTKNLTTFDYMAPGIIVFAILMLAINVATILTREVENGTLNRLKLSKMTAFDFLFGGLLPWSLVVVAQVLILFAVALAIGFNYNGGLNSIILAVIVGVIGGIASISLGMIIAAFAKNPPQASQLGTLIAVPTSFIIGAFIQLPQVVLGNVMGQQFQIYDILPWTHVLTALRGVLTFGYGWNGIAYDVGWAVVLTVIIFAIGVFLFSRTRLSPENE